MVSSCRFVPDLVDVEQELFELPRKVSSQLANKSRTSDLIYARSV
jgi:hypothetical protein